MMWHFWHKSERSMTQSWYLENMAQLRHKCSTSISKYWHKKGRSRLHGRSFHTPSRRCSTQSSPFPICITQIFIIVRSLPKSFGELICDSDPASARHEIAHILIAFFILRNSQFPSFRFTSRFGFVPVFRLGMIKVTVAFLANSFIC